MMLSLTEWKKKALTEQKTYYKGMLSEGLELPETEVAEEAAQEYMIESFSESVDFEEIDMTTEVVREDNLVEYLDFVPSVLGEETDLVLEFRKLPTFSTLASLKETLFASDYDVIEEAEQAKVVFSKAKGGVQKKLRCAPGTMLKGKKCIPQTGAAKAKNKKLGIKIAKAKKSQGAAGKKRAAVKAQITKKRVSGKARNLSGTE